MGCVASKLEEEEEVVSICRERKRQLKSAVERRYALADAHYRYCESLYRVSAAIHIFVARHSPPSSQFFITFPPPCPPSPPAKENAVVSDSNPMFLQQTPSAPTQQAIGGESPGSSSSTASDSDEEREENHGREKEAEQQVCGYFYMDLPPSMPSPQRDFGWDFFNPFVGVRPEIITGYNRNSDDDLRVVREQEGIPELEEEDDDEEEHKTEEQQNKTVVAEERENTEHQPTELAAATAAEGANMSHDEQLQKGLTVIDTPVRGRELLEALKDIEDHFLRACDSGKDVSRMLEANRVPFQSNLEEIKESSTKLIQAITRRSTSTRSSSCKSIVPSSSKNSSTWTEFNNDLFNDCGGMDSGSHSLTLGRLYAWEKKLYEEVKAGDSVRKIYEKKCNQLRNQDAKGEEGLTVDKTRAAVKDLYSQILVTIRSAESISMRIEKLRDEELQPQIMELIQGLTRTWKIMSESHEIQNKIIFEVKTFNCSAYGKFSNTLHKQATSHLEYVLRDWRISFARYISSQKAYIEALNGWLSKFIAPDVEFNYKKGSTSVEFNSKTRSSTASSLEIRPKGPPLLVISHKWLSSMEKLPVRAVSFSMKCLAKEVTALRVQQEKEFIQKRKVDGLSKELDRKILAFQKIESKFFESDQNPDQKIENLEEFLKERSDLVDNLSKKAESEKEKHRECVEETKRITLNGFQTRFCRVFESLNEFSKALLEIYNEITVHNEERAEKVCIEGSRLDDDEIRV